MDVEGIRSRLESLSAGDPERKRFGAASHEYRLRPPVAEADVARFEKLYRIALPDEYRAFLLEVGDGGAGPCHGLMSLSDSEYELRGTWDEYSPPLGVYLTMDFERPTSLEVCRSRDYFRPGMLPISDCGCMSYHFLCTAGSDRGRVWSWSPDNVWRPASMVLHGPGAHDRPADDDEAVQAAWFDRTLREDVTSGLGFLAWYEAWLES